MIPILFEKDATGFATNGLGRLRDCISCAVTEERNGVYECDFEYPVDGARYEDIQLGRIIVVEHDDTGTVQPFDIVSCSKPISGVVTFHAVHISYRLSKVVVSGTNIDSLASAMTMLGTGEPENDFTFTPQFTSSAHMAAADGTPRSARQMLGGVEGSILDTYGGELEFDRFNVILWSARGTDRNLTIRYGVNLTGYDEDMDASETYSAAIPYWKGSDGTIVKGSLVDSGQQTVTGRTEAVALDFTEKFETKPTAAQLETLARSMMTSGKTAQPKQNISVSFVRETDPQLAALQVCRLCDRVQVVFPRYGMSGMFKIVKVVWNVLGERYEEMELGALSTTLSEALGISNDLADEVTTKLTPTSTDYTSSYGTLTVQRLASIVILLFTGVVYAYPTGWTTVATLPAGVQPPKRVDFGIVDNNTAQSAKATMLGRITTAGAVQVYKYSDNVASVNQPVFNAAFIIE